MDIEQAYNIWAQQYDNNVNKTRDLEAKVLRNSLRDIDFDSCLEIGAGTGKNTVWLIQKAKHITAVDISAEMLAKAKEKIQNKHVDFVQADINAPWHFVTSQYDLVTFSLVLEHIRNLDNIFKQASLALKTGGHLYAGELHPFKQYAGSKARFETENGLQVVTCFNHHASDFIKTAEENNLRLTHLDEHFDNDNREDIPRILSLIFTKQ